MTFSCFECPSQQRPKHRLPTNNHDARHSYYKLATVSHRKGKAKVGQDGTTFNKFRSKWLLIHHSLLCHQLGTGGEYWGTLDIPRAQSSYSTEAVGGSVSWDHDGLSSFSQRRNQPHEGSFLSEQPCDAARSAKTQDQCYLC